MKKILCYPEDLSVETFIEIFVKTPGKLDDVLRVLRKPKLGNLKQTLNEIQSGKHMPTTKMLYRLASVGIMFKVNPQSRTLIRVSELRDYLVQEGISQYSICEELDLQASILSNYLSMKIFPSCERLQQIGELLNVQFRFDDYDNVMELSSENT